MKRFIREFFERLKAVYHIFADKEYAIYTLSTRTIPEGEVVRESSCCIISDNASVFFLDCIKLHVEKYIENEKEGNNVCKECFSYLEKCCICGNMGCPDCEDGWGITSKGDEYICPNCFDNGLQDNSKNQS